MIALLKQPPSDGEDLLDDLTDGMRILPNLPLGRWV
jgi:hypothetical protein